MPDLNFDYSFENDSFYELMSYKIRDILLISSLYDAYILEHERLLSEQIFGEYHQLNLTSAPKITHASSLNRALEYLKNKHFDLVIVMRRLSDISIFEIGSKIRQFNDKCFIILLLNNNSEISLFEGKEEQLTEIDNIFVWNGDSKVFLAMIKYIEDKVNAVKDTKISMTRIILLVEDSIRYYSRFLPVLYTQIMKQTQRLITEENLDDMIKVLRMRARPKILLARDYESAIRIIDRYKEYLLCLVSDISFPREGEIDPEGGFNLIKYLRTLDSDIPAILQSSDISNKKKAKELHCSFMHKDSGLIDKELTEFMLNNLGFGDFIFKDADGNEIGRAGSMEEFKIKIKDIPRESVLYHAKRNHFSAWLLARGEIHYAKILQPVKVCDFQSPEKLKEYIIDIFNKIKIQKVRGRIIGFDESMLYEHSHIVKISDGSLGGKGRGLAFINSLLQKLETQKIIRNINIMIPKTAIIGTDEFEEFLSSNNLSIETLQYKDDKQLKEEFLKAELSPETIKRLKILLSNYDQPLAIRSSGLFEDSFSLPFAGVYSTYLLPNNEKDPNIRLKRVMDAIKLIYASVFSSSAKSYFKAVHYNIEDEKMAVIIQNIIGNRYEDVFYPHISGIAQSYNYYPVSYLKMDDGLAVMAVGLGKYVVEGEISFRFCPKFPKLDILDLKQILRNNQKSFYAVDLNKASADLIEGENITLKNLDIKDIHHDFINHCISIYDHENDRLDTSYNKKGERIVNFANMLKYRSYPLAETIELLLEVLKDAMGTPVEMEFALDISNKQIADFYILQIKPLISNLEEMNTDLKNIRKEDLFILSEKAIGNGIADDIRDIICIDLDRFDIRYTIEMAKELESINDYFIKENRHYILIGPGRWGTRDRWLGIPVQWSQISQAKVIIEYNTRDFQVETSLGSHFFCNIISMNIGYFAIPYNKPPNFIDHEWLKERKSIRKTNYFLHYRFREPLRVIMDARKSVSVVYKESKGGL